MVIAPNHRSPIANHQRFKDQKSPNQQSRIRPCDREDAGNRSQKVVDDIAPVNATTSIAFALGPDDVKVELLENKQQTVPITLHHIHFFGQQNAEMRAWYAKVFGAKPRDAANFLVADLPGVALNFSPSPTPVVGTKGRAVDHIGFEVKNLEAFCKRLEEMGIKLDTPYRNVPAVGLALAFVTDPWGTSIELNEGLDTIQ